MSYTYAEKFIYETMLLHRVYYFSLPLSLVSLPHENRLQQAQLRVRSSELRVTHQLSQQVVLLFQLDDSTASVQQLQPKLRHVVRLFGQRRQKHLTLVAGMYPPFSGGDAGGHSPLHVALLRPVGSDVVDEQIVRSRRRRLLRVGVRRLSLAGACIQRRRQLLRGLLLTLNLRRLHQVRRLQSVRVEVSPQLCVVRGLQLKAPQKQQHVTSIRRQLMCAETTESDRHTVSTHLPSPSLLKDITFDN